jgi:hypothetical protein
MKKFMVDTTAGIELKWNYVAGKEGKRQGVKLFYRR